jgi:hypothetical protein
MTVCVQFQSVLQLINFFIIVEFQIKLNSKYLFIINLILIYY